MFGDNLNSKDYSKWILISVFALLKYDPSQQKYKNVYI